MSIRRSCRDRTEETGATGQQAPPAYVTRLHKWHQVRFRAGRTGNRPYRQGPGHPGLAFEVSARQDSKNQLELGI